ncbi:hypothetical protein AAVH_06767 [Aphelenchoides avenae]|nr:hypothetical protein AAVH_06767 [Aphelenchus avenae]
MGALLAIPNYEEVDEHAEASTSAEKAKTPRDGTLTPLLNESIVDVFTYLDRDNLDLIQIVCRRFRDLIGEHMNAVCQRPMTAHLYGHTAPKHPSTFTARVTLKKLEPDNADSSDEEKEKDDDEEENKDEPAKKKERKQSEDFTARNLKDVVAWMMRRLRCAAVMEDFEISNVTVTWDLVNQLKPLGSSVRVVDRLIVHSISASPETLLELLINCFGEVHAFRMDQYDYDPTYFPAHAGDALIRAAAKKGIEGVFFPYSKPIVGDHYALGEDAILDYCLGEHGRPDAPRELEARHLQLAPGFFKRLVEANRKSSVTGRVLLVIDCLRPHNQDTTAFDDIRKLYQRSQVWDFRDGDIHFQILIYQTDHDDPLVATLELRRWKEPTDGSNFFF